MNRLSRRVVAGCGTLLCAWLLALPAHAADYLLPSILMRQGETAVQTYTFDTRISLLYTGELDASVDITLFDRSTGQPLTGGDATAICDPCHYALDATTPQQTFTLDSLVEAANGFFPSPVKQAYARIVTGGSDPASLAIQAQLLNSHATTDEISAHVIPLIPLGAGGGTPAVATLPLLSTTPGSYFTAPGNEDSRVDVFYLGDSSATVLVFVLNEDGSTYLGTSSCAPCTLSLSPSHRYDVVNLETLIASSGGTRRLRVDLMVTGDREQLGIAAFSVHGRENAFSTGFEFFVPIEVLNNVATRFIFRDGFEGLLLRSLLTATIG